MDAFQLVGVGARMLQNGVNYSVAVGSQRSFRSIMGKNDDYMGFIKKISCCLPITCYMFTEYNTSICMSPHSENFMYKVV